MSFKMLSDISNIKNVHSYHVNVGHGNTSFIIIESLDKTYKTIGVDCSLTNDKVRCKKNTDECIDYIKKKFSLEKFELDMFLLTHPHHDHYSGVDYLINRQIIVKDTKICMNNAFIMRSSFLFTIKQKLFNLGCKFINPVSSTTKNLNMIKIWYPDNIVIKKGTLSKVKTYSHLSIQEESSPNNASIVIAFNFDINNKTYSILFTGDIEKKGWNQVKCPPHLGEIQYYCISHHGSLNGHQRSVCHHGQTITNITTCPNHISKAILMGRNGAYKGVYSKKVTTDFKGKIVKTERNKFIELEFATGNVKNYK